MDHALDILNYIQAPSASMRYERTGVDIHEFIQTDRDHAKALVWGKDGFAVITVEMCDGSQWPWRPTEGVDEVHDGSILYAGEGDAAS